jgi:hypothetical protein
VDLVDVDHAAEIAQRVLDLAFGRSVVGGPDLRRDQRLLASAGQRGTQDLLGCAVHR